MIPLADFTLGHALLTVLEIFLFVAWIWVLISLFGDLFNDRSVSGWGKAAWTFLLFLVPFLGVLIYLIARGGGMQERAMARAAAAQQQFDAYIRQAAGSSPAGDLESLARLRSQGVLSEAEFEQAKQRLLVEDGRVNA
jgi:ABC-type multidrug transport system fused ATPase/permease subunit